MTKLNKYKPDKSKALKGIRGSKRETFVILQEVEEESSNLYGDIYNPNMFRRMKLQDMLTIVPLKSSGISGITKKVLHSPSLKILIIKEVPINMGAQPELFEEKLLEKYLKRWQKHCSSNSSFLNLHDIMWNVPQGKASLVLEHCSYGSLKVSFLSKGIASKR